MHGGITYNSKSLPVQQGNGRRATGRQYLLLIVLQIALSFFHQGILAAAQNTSSCPFSCTQTPCVNLGICNPKTSTCKCIDGFTGNTCSDTACGSINQNWDTRPALSPGSTNCSCDPGFTGINCNVCQYDSACAGYQNGTIICNKSPVPFGQKFEGYCGLNEPTLASLYPLPTTITLQLDHINSVLYTSVWYNSSVQFSCQARDCSQTQSDNRYITSCQIQTCSCTPQASFCGGPGGNIDISATVSSIVGGLTFSCPKNGNNNCNLGIEYVQSLFPDGFDIPNCMFGECVLASLAYAPPVVQSSIWNSVSIAGVTIVCMIGAALFVFLGAAWWDMRQLKAKDDIDSRIGMDVSFVDVTYTLAGKHILKGVSGSVKAGQMLAILGPSGAGKSTLLDILAGKLKAGEVSCSVLYGKQTMSRTNVKFISGYVDQEDVLMASMTVRETLMFSANLRLPESYSADKKTLIVDEILDELGLTHVRDSFIGGNQTRGISGGERRRVSIGIELVTAPAILYLDEPTSGLDSYSAFQVVKVLANLAHNKTRTLIFTIHQPRSDMFALFDNILLLSKGGTMYSGPASQAMRFFEACDKPCPEGYNIADHLLDLATERGRKESATADSVKPPGTVVKLSHSKMKRVQDHVSSIGAISESFADIMNFFAGKPPSPANKIRTLERRSTLQNIEENTYRVGFLTQTWVLMGRSMRNLIRQPSLLLAHILSSAFLGVFIGGIYFHSDNSLGGIQNRLGSVLFILSLLGFSSMSAIGTLSTERKLIIRERANGFYRVMPFFVTKVMFDIIPLRIIPALVLSIPAYFMIGYSSTGTHFPQFLLVVLIFNIDCALFCLSIGIGFTQIGAANLVASIALLFKLLFAGFLVNQDTIPRAVSWIPYLSFFKYAFEALVVNDLSGVVLSDSFSGTSVSFSINIVLSKFGLNINHFWMDTVILLGIFIGLLVTVALLMTYRLIELR